MSENNEIKKPLNKNNKVPKLRLNGFNNCWKTSKLGELLLIERGGSPRPIESYISKDGTGYNWIKIGDANETGYINNTQEKIIAIGLKKTRKVYKGDLILSNSMSFGRPYILNIDGCIHDGWLLIRDKNNFSIYFS